MLSRARAKARHGSARCGVVDEDVVLADVGDLDDAQLPVGAHHHAALAVGAERHRLAVDEVDHHLVARLLAW